MIKLYFTTFFASLFLAFNTNAQQKAKAWCATDQAMEQFVLNTPEKKAQYLKDLAEFNELVAKQDLNKSKTTFIIPTVVHVIHFNGNGNISDEQVIDGINQINEDLKRLNSDTNLTRSIFKPFAGSIDLEFRLAKIDTGGNCTNGIVRYNDASTNNFGGTDVLKSRWNNLNNGQRQYFNFWIVNDIENFTGGGGVILGYAYYPGSSGNTLYGVVNRNDAWGRVGNIIYQGRTPTHEVGHALNLPHTFNGACGSDCSTSGDFVCDTPPAASATQGCNPSLNSCTNDLNGPSPFSQDMPNQIENYMSYDDCQNMFSIGQVNRMTTALNNTSILSGLTDPQNLINTGTDDAYYFSAPPCTPIAEFSVDKKVNCEGGTFTFKDLSYNAPKDSTWTYAWSFPGGTPASSTDMNPVVSYSQPGSYNVSLVVTNNVGSSVATTKTSYLDVIAGSGNFIAPKTVFFTEPGFPNYASDPSLSWEITNHNNAASTWTRNSNAFFSGPASVYIDNYNLSSGSNGLRHSLITPVSDLTQINNAYLNFRIAYARRNNEVEVMNIYYSQDCGASWKLLKTELSIYLYSRPALSNQAFIPSGELDWSPYSLDISSLAGQDNIKFRLEFKTLGGNNIYIDNFEISESPLTSLSPEKGEINDLNIYPNPGKGKIRFELGRKSQETIRFEIVNSLGELIDTFTMNPGQLGFDMDLSHLNSGLYFIRSEMQGLEIKKLIIQ